MDTPDAAEIPFRTLANSSGNLDSGGGLFFCRSEQRWASKWSMLNNHRTPLPDLDWESEMVVLLVCGTRPSGGYDVTIESIADDGAWVEVQAVERRPGPRAFTTQALTNPFHAVAVSAHDGAERLLLRIEYSDFG